VAERLSVLETDLRGLRATFGAVSTFAGLVFGLLGIALAWNVTSERSDLREFQKGIKEEVQHSLGQVAEEPLISLATADRRSLDGAVVQPVLQRDSSGHLKVLIPAIMTNTGRGWSGDIALKLYTTRAISQPDRSTDEPSFVFEGNWLGPNTNTPSMPGGGYSTPYDLTIWSTVRTIPPGSYPCLVKVYYGRGKVTRAAFTLLIQQRGT